MMPEATAMMNRLLLNSELSSMIGLLRKQLSSSRFFADNGPIIELIDDFGKIRIKTMDPRYLVDCAEGLAPFIKLFRSTDTTGPIVVGALESFQKFLSLGYFSSSEGDVEIFKIAFEAISKCRFEATDLNQDEVALMKVTGTLLEALQHPLAKHITDQQVCFAIEASVRLCFQSRFTELLRQTSCIHTVQMIQIIFQHIPRISAMSIEEDGPALKLIALPFSKVADGPETPSLAIKDTSDEAEISNRPFGFNCLAEILSFLSRLLDGGKLSTEERVKILAADCLSVVIISDLLAKEELFRVLSTNVCRNLCSHLDISTSPNVARRLIFPLCTLFIKYRRLMPAQFENMLVSLIGALKAKPQPNSKNLSRLLETKTVFLEMLLEFIEDPLLMGDLYIHYECDVRYSMVLSELVQCLGELAHNMDSRNGGNETNSLLSMQMLNRMVYELAKYGKDYKMVHQHESPKSQIDYAETRKVKLAYQEAVSLFNQKPKDAVSYLQKHGILSDPVKAEEMARFLRRTPGLDKKEMGDYLSKPGNEEILSAFMADFEFHPGQTIDEALRHVLETFRLPGEAQQIARVMEAFAKAYYEDVGHVNAQFASVDATYVLAYSIVMLNTDLHNPQNERKMKPEEWVRNNRGINEGVDFEESLLKQIYHQISTREIMIPKESPSPEHVWNEVIRKADSYVVDSNPFPELARFEIESYLIGMVNLLFNPFLTAYLPSGSGSASKSEDMLRITFSGVDLLSRLLADLELHPLMAELIEALWQASGIPAELNQSLPVTSPSAASPSVAQNAQLQICRAKVIKHLAKSELCSMVLQTMFGVVLVSGPSMKAGWRSIASAIISFAECGLITLETSNDEDKSSEQQNVSHVSSAFSITGDSNDVTLSLPTVDFIDSETKKKAMATVREACQLDKILEETKYYQEDSLQALLQAISQSLLFKGSSEASIVMMTEWMILIAWNNRDRLKLLWPTLSTCLADLSKLAMPRVCEHAVLGLGKMTLWIVETYPENESISKDVHLYIQVLNHLPAETFQKISEQGVSLTLKILKAGKPSVILADPSASIWPHYFTLLSQSSRHRACDPSTYGLLSLLFDGSESSLLLPLDFFTEFCDLFVGFISNSITSSPGKVTAVSLASKEKLLGTGGSGGASPTLSDLVASLASDALEQIFHLQQKLLLIKVDDTEWWDSYITHLHSEVAKLCIHQSRVLRQQALSLLQRLVLSIDFEPVPVTALISEFETVLIPLLMSLYQLPESSKKSVEAIEETQMRASSIVCKALLQNISLLLPQSEQFESLWKDLIETLLGLMKGRSDVLRESIPESIKNMLLVMATSDRLSLIDPTAEGEHFWTLTWSLLDPTIPRLHQDLTGLTNVVESRRASMDIKHQEDQEPEHKDEVEEELEEAIEEVEVVSLNEDQSSEQIDSETQENLPRDTEGEDEAAEAELSEEEVDADNEAAEAIPQSTEEAEEVTGEEQLPSPAISDRLTTMFDV